VILAARTLGPRRTLPGSLNDAAVQIRDAGGKATPIQCDMANSPDIERLVTTTMESAGRIDVVVNNAADMVGGDLEETIETLLGKAAPKSADSPGKSPLDNWLRQFATNVHGPYLLTTLAAPHMKAQGGGVVINITGEAADLVPLQTALQRPSLNPSIGTQVTKAALNRLSNALAALLAPSNIAVVAVDPGTVRTEAAEMLRHAGIPTPEGAPLRVPAMAVIEILTDDNPMRYSGEIVRAQP
jgi:NAD(P)-dependent dehydrogenase (short-subunit alcohol dehydrogenase family)